MKVLITGGSGFIGRNLKEQLSGKYDISAPASSELDLLDAASVSDYLRRSNFDAVIHAATWNATTVSTKNTSLVLENNLRMFFNIARCSSGYGKMIYYGSGAEYDRRHWVPKMKEDYFDKHVPSDQYGFSKYLMRKFAEKSDNIYDLCLFGVFGKYEDWQIRFISNACCKAMWDLPVTIKQNVIFDYMHIDDLVKATQWFMSNSPKEKVYNICTGQTKDLFSLAKHVLKISGKDLDIIVRSGGMGTEYSGDNSRIANEAGENFFSDPVQHIVTLYSWYLENRQLINKQELLSDK